MGWRALCVSGGADVAKHRACRNAVANVDVSGVGIEMDVVVDAPAFTDYRDSLATEVVLTNLVDVTAGGGENRCATWCEDVLAFVMPSIAPRRLPGIGNPIL